MGNTCYCCNPSSNDQNLTIEKYENHEHYQAGDFYINPILLANHDLKNDDYAQINEEEMIEQGVDRYHMFDFRFPFYKMNVNGFIFHIKTAANKMRAAESDTPLYNIDQVSLYNLQLSFSDFESWSDLKNEESDLVRYLKSMCMGED